MVGDGLKVFTAEEVAIHNHSSSAYIILENKVYDVTTFLAEHPGGEQVLMELAGQDATNSFHDVGHSKDAKAMAEQYLVGHLGIPGSKHKTNNQSSTTNCIGASWREIILSPTWSNFLIPLGISIAVYCCYSFARTAFAR